MNSWTNEELDKIGNSDELQIVTFREDGIQYKPVPIWVVRVGDDLYIRSYRGKDGMWYRHIQNRKEGQISSGGITKSVTFIEAYNDDGLNNKIDVAYRTKYQKYSNAYIDPMITSQARSTTIKISPREQ